MHASVSHTLAFERFQFSETQVAPSYSTARESLSEEGKSMKFAIIAVAALSLSGCVRSMEHVAALPPTDSAVTKQSPQAVRDCLVPIMDKVRSRPVETGTDARREIAFVGETGTIAFYVLEPVAEGTRVTAHRRKMISDNYNKARSCFVKDG